MPALTVVPLSTTVILSPSQVISKRFHSPTGRSAWVLGVTPARRAGGVDGSVRRPYISPEPIGQHQIFT